MRCFVTGCAGFIGSNLVDRLLKQGHEVIGYDNFSTGLKDFLKEAQQNARFKLIEADLLNRETLNLAMQNTDIVFLVLPCIFQQTLYAQILGQHGEQFLLLLMFLLKLHSMRVQEFQN